jgi:hypothetical protein
MNAASMSLLRSLVRKLQLGSSRTAPHRNSRNGLAYQRFRFVPMFEKCEDRISPALTFNFMINDPANQFGGRQAAMMTDLQAAGAIWGQYLNGMVPLNVSVVPGGTPFASAGATYNQPLNRQQNGLNVVEDGALNKARTGTPNTGPNPAADIQININPAIAQNQFYYDPSGVARTGQVPANQSDFISVMLHELAHGLGFNVLRSTMGATYGTFPNGTENTYDALTSFGAGGNPALVYFTGPQAMQVFGGPVPLTSEGPNGTSNFAHVGSTNPPIPMSLASDLMLPAITDGVKISVSRLDLAVLTDINWPVLPNPVFTTPDPRLLMPPIRTSLIAVGADAGAQPLVNVFNPVTNTLVTSFMAFPTTFSGGVRVAVGDVTGDGSLDIICGAGPGASPEVRVFAFDPTTMSINPNPIMDFIPLPLQGVTFTGGLWVAAGDVNGDGRADIVTAADRGGGPQVSITSGADLSGRTVLSNFFATLQSFTGGIRVACADLNGDGFADVIAGAGPGGSPQITIFDGRSMQRVTAYFAFGPQSAGFSGGVFVAAGDINGGGMADIIVGAAPGGGPQVTVATFANNTATLLTSFFAISPNSFTGGVRVGAAVTRNNTEQLSILAAAGPGGGPQVTFWDYNGTVFQQSSAFNGITQPTFTNGLFIGGYPGLVQTPEPTPF